MVCTCKKCTKFIIYEINKKTKNRKYTCKQLFYLFIIKFKIYWNTIYKLIKYDIIYINYKKSKYYVFNL